MFAENAERISTAPISSATARRALPMTCRLDVHGRRHRPASRRRRLAAPAVPGPSTSRRPARPRPRRRAAARSWRGRRSSGPAARARCAAPRARARASGRRSRSAPRARGGTRSATSPAERDGELERLAAVAEVGLAVAPAARRRPASGIDVASARASRRSSPSASPSAESTPAAAGRAPCAISSSSASAHACSGPAPPKATSAKSARIVAALDRDDAAARAASRRSRPRRRPPGRDRPRERALGGGAVELEAAGEARPASRPSRRFASVTVGSVPPRP